MLDGRGRHTGDVIHQPATQLDGSFHRRQTYAVDGEEAGLDALLHPHRARVDEHHDRVRAELVVDPFILLDDSTSRSHCCLASES